MAGKRRPEAGNRAAWPSRAAAVGSALAVAALSACGSDPPAAALDRIAPHVLEAHLRFLDSPGLQGRREGTEGAAIAALYIASQMEAAGLRPIGRDSGYLQPISFLIAIPEPELHIRAAGGAELDLHAGTDYVARTTAPVDSLTVSGELIFVGSGISGDGIERDDYKDADLTGRIAVALSARADLVGAAGGAGDRAADLATRALQLDAAARHGATAVVFVDPAEVLAGADDLPPGRVREEVVYLRDEAPPEVVGLEVNLGPGSVRRLLDVTGLRIESLVESALSPEFRPIAIGASATLTVRNRLREAGGFNVAGWLPGAGADPAADRSDDAMTGAIVVAAHYDGPPARALVGGDRTAPYESAAGAAVLLGLVDAFAALEPLPRPLLFLAVTGAESGFVGLREYARAPLVAPARTELAVQIGHRAPGAADLVGVSGRRTGLERAILAAADAEGLTLYDRAPNPLAGHLREPGFAEIGIAALQIEPAPPGPAGPEPRRPYPEELSRQARFAFRLLLALARGDARLEADPDAAAVAAPVAGGTTAARP